MPALSASQIAVHFFFATHRRLSALDSPCAALCWDLHGWVGKALAPHRRGPCWGFVGLAWASHRIADFGMVYARSKRKREKGGGVAMHPTSGSQRPATPVVSRDSGLSRVQVKNRVVNSTVPRKKGCKPHKWLCNSKYPGVAI